MRLVLILLSSIASVALGAAFEVAVPSDKQRWWPMKGFSTDGGDMTGDCDPKFFEMTPKNLEESGSDAFYRDFILKNAKAHPEEYDRLGEVAFFARYAFNGIDVHCSSAKGGCTGIPLCKDILNHVEGRGGDKEEARNIYFSIKKIELMADAMYWFHKILIMVEQNAGLLSDRMVQDFTPQSNGKADSACKMYKQGIDAMMSFVKTAIGAFSPSIGNFSTGAWITLAMQIAQDSAETGKEFRDAARLDRIVRDGSIGAPGLDMSPTYATGYCSTFMRKSGRPDENFAHGAALKRQVVTIASSARGIISRILDIVMSGNALTDPGSNVIYEVMVGQNWTEGARQRYAMLDEETATRLFKESLMTLTWQNSKCYQKCLCNEDGTPQSLCHNEDEDAKLRHCPQDGKGCACQLQCYTSILDGGNREIELLGKDKLADWGVEFDDILVESYKNYQRTHNSNMVTGESLMGGMQRGESQLSLPTCASSQIIMGDLHAKSRGFFGHAHNHFPCTCGDWRSNETETFMNNLGLGKTQGEYQLGLSKSLFKKDCPRDLLRAKLKPLNHFLAYCELGIKWPHKGDISKTSSLHLKDTFRTHMNMTDSRCDAIKEETADMEEMEANLYFCRSSKLAKGVFTDERPHIDNTGLALPGFGRGGVDAGSHSHMCRRWLKSMGGAKGAGSGDS